MTMIEDRPAADPSPAEPAPPAAPAARWSPRSLRLPRAPQSRSTRATAAGWICAVLGVIALWAVLYALVISGLQERHDQQVLYSQFREQLSGQTKVAPVGGDINPGAPVALISMPRLGAQDTVVVQGTASGDLESGPGHARDTVLPGQLGTSVIYGRSVMFGAPFANLPAAQRGDLITTVTGQGKATFVVTDVRRAGDPYPPALPATGARLTLVTSESSGWRSGWAPSDVVYVDATLKGKAFTDGALATAIVPDPEKAMQGDPSGLYPLVLWLPLLGCAFALVVWAQERWGRWQTWIVGMPVVLAALWGTTETAVELLPNLL